MVNLIYQRILEGQFFYSIKWIVIRWPHAKLCYTFSKHHKLSVCLYNTVCSASALSYMYMEYQMLKFTPSDCLSYSKPWSQHFNWHYLVYFCILIVLYINIKLSKLTFSEMANPSCFKIQIPLIFFVKK